MDERSHNALTVVDEDDQLRFRTYSISGITGNGTEPLITIRQPINYNPKPKGNSGKNIDGNFVKESIATQTNRSFLAEQALQLNEQYSSHRSSSNSSSLHPSTPPTPILNRQSSETTDKSSVSRSSNVFTHRHVCASCVFYLLQQRHLKHHQSDEHRRKVRRRRERKRSDKENESKDSNSAVSNHPLKEPVKKRQLVSVGIQTSKPLITVSSDVETPIPIIPTKNLRESSVQTGSTKSISPQGRKPITWNISFEKAPHFSRRTLEKQPAKVENSVTLQDAFRQKCNNFIKRSQSRVRDVNLKTLIRKMTFDYRELNIQNSKKIMNDTYKKQHITGSVIRETNGMKKSIDHSRVTTLTAKRSFTEKEMKKQTQRKYIFCPEVKTEKERRKLAEDKQTHRIMAQIFAKKVKERALHGHVNWPISKAGVFYSFLNCV